MKKIRNKLTLVMMAVTLIPALLIGGYSLYSSFSGLRDQALSGQKAALGRMQQQIESLAAGVERDLFFLRDSSALQLYLSSLSDKKKAGRKRSALLLSNAKNSFVQFANQQQIYSSLGFLDTQGLEKISVATEGNNAKALRKSQDQRGNDYFKETVDLQRGQLYISDVVLLRDGGEIKQPHKSVFHYATVVSDRNGTTQGVLVLGVDFDKLTAQLQTQKGRSWDLQILDPDGFYLHHSDEDKRWGSPRNLGTGHNAFTDKTLGLSELRDSKKLSTTENDDTIMLLQPVTLGKQKPALGSLLSVTPVSALYANLKRPLYIFLGIILGSLLLSLLLARLLANSLSKPLMTLRDQVNAFSQGDLDTPVKAEARNEIGDLAHSIELLRKSMNILMDRVRNG